MPLRQQQKLRNNAQFLVRGAVFLLVSLTLVAPETGPLLFDSSPS
jgi:hypothetical protein